MKKYFLGIILLVVFIFISCDYEYSNKRTYLKYKTYDFLLYDKYPVKIKIPKDLKLFDFKKIAEIYIKENCFIRDTSACNTFWVYLSEISIQNICNNSFENFGKKPQIDSIIESNISFKNDEIRLYSATLGNANYTKDGYEFLKNDFNTLQLLLIIQKKSGLKYLFHTWVYIGNKSKQEIQNNIDLYDKIQIEDYSVK